MTRYPRNPYWDHEGDRPIEFFSQEDWNRAKAARHLTLEHVLARLHNIAEYEFGNGADMGYGESGFLEELTAAAMFIERKVKLRVYPNDHPPPHVHIEIKSEPDLKLRISLETGTVMDDIPDGWAKRVRRFQSEVLANRDVLAGWWADYHGYPIVVG